MVIREHPHPSFAAQLEAAAAVQLSATGHPGVRRALEFLAGRPPTDWSVAALPRQASLSPGYFARVFTEEIGVPRGNFSPVGG